MAANGNGTDLKRTQIVTLLYIIFVCFSVLNIKISILDSNSYSIKSFEILDKENRKKITDSIAKVRKVVKDSLAVAKNKRLQEMKKLFKTHNFMRVYIFHGGFNLFAPAE